MLAMPEDSPTRLRETMVQIVAAHAELAAAHTGRARLDQRVLDAMARVARHEFVPAQMRPYAYANQPLPIGHGQTISQPFIVALMTDLLALRHEDRVLEVGTGLGYQAAILSELAGEVYSVEIIEELATDARARLDRLGYGRVVTRAGDGSHGWSEQAPFDKILVAAAPELIPVALLEQLRPGGRMVLPTGIEDAQQLVVVEKRADGRVSTREILPVRFAPLVTVH